MQSYLESCISGVLRATCVRHVCREWLEETLLYVEDTMIYSTWINSSCWDSELLWLRSGKEVGGVFLAEPWSFPTCYTSGVTTSFFTVPHWEENHESREEGCVRIVQKIMNKVLRLFILWEWLFEKLGLGLARDVSTEILDYVLGSFYHLWLRANQLTSLPVK